MAANRRRSGGRGPLLLLVGLVVLILIGVVVYLVVIRGNQSTTTGTTAVETTVVPGSNTVPPGGAGVGGSQTSPLPTQIQVAVPTATPSVNVRVLAVKRNLSAGTVVTPEDLQEIDKPRAEFDPNQDIEARNINFVLNRILRVSYNPGQIIRRGDLIEGSFSNYMKQLVADKRLEPGKKAFAYATNDLSTAAGLVAEGDLVDVVATYVFERRDRTDSGLQSTTSIQSGNVITTSTTVPTRNGYLELTTKTVLQNIRVLRIIRFGPALTSIQVPQPSATAGPVISQAPDQAPPTPTVPNVVVPTATPEPTLPPYQESGAQFPVSTVLVLAVTDQEAEVLKFSRETRTALSASVLSTSSSIFQPGGTGSAQLAALQTIPVIHFALRGRPVDPANPQDPAITVDRTSGVTYRTLVRDYGLPIPEVVFATQGQ